MTKLSININKIATLRNARGANNPDVVKVALDCERFGAQGITVHPRPDERHIRTQDVYNLKQAISTEFNIEGYPDKRYMDMIRETRPAQATLVPDPPNAITSDAGWNTEKNLSQLQDIVAELKSFGARVSIFLDPSEKMVEFAKLTGTDRIEFYTEPYAKIYPVNRTLAIKDYILAAKKATELGIDINAGHDLDLHNVNYLIHLIPQIKEVSIGHALICDALYFGLENTVQMYLRELKL